MAFIMCRSTLVVALMALLHGVHAVDLAAMRSELDPTTECNFRMLSYEYGLKLRPDLSPNVLAFDALELNSMCGVSRPKDVPAAWPSFPTPSNDEAYFVDFIHGKDENSGTMTSPFKTLSAAIMATRKHVLGPRAVLLRKGIHYLTDTITLGAADSNLVIQNYNGEEAWISGGVPLTTDWTPYNTSSRNMTCPEKCVAAGHCCVGTVSSFDHPSCEQGCLVGASAGSEAECEQVCHDADKKCDYTYKNLTLQMCDSCPKHCDASDGVIECIEGCKFASGMTEGFNIWKTKINEDIDNIPGLFTVDPHVRYMRARFPNPRSGTNEIRPVGKLSGSNVVEWHAPPKLPAATQVVVNASAMSGFDSSILSSYNLYASGNCEKVNDPMCPCGAWSDVRDGKWTSSSYWCSNISAGGWSEMDRGNGYYNGPILPQGMTYNKSMLPNFSAYKNLSGAILQAWRAQGWFVNMYDIVDHDRDAGVLTFGKGGFQGGRGWQLNGTSGAIDPSPPFFIENVFEELDIGTEFFYNTSERVLYVFYNATSGDKPPAALQFVATRLRRLVEVVGSKAAPVTNVTLRGVGFRDTHYTYMDPWGVPSGGDWSLHRGGAVFLEGTEHVAVNGCTFRRVDGNALFFSGYNRHGVADRNTFEFIGDTAMAGWGYTDEHSGVGGEQPRFTQITNNVCREVGVMELQSSCWFQAKTAQTNVSGNLFYNGPRAGINMNDGFGGGNSLQSNLIFNQCRQSGDHGPINSWDRQLFWTDVRDGPDHPGWNPAYTDVSKNVIIANYGGSQGFDNDDGSSWNDIHHNVIYGEGLKQDYGGHDSKYQNNLNLVHHYDGQNCINTWPFKLGTPPCGDWSTNATCSHAHHFTNNTCVVLYTDVYSPGAGSCDGQSPQMAYLAENKYYTPNGNATLDKCGGLQKLQSTGAELGSKAFTLPTDAEWLTWAKAILEM
eukprot:m.757752 g.757752  ORF g.757752 m.757752 type:complete len:945 (+) comp23189_c0_seq1:37-2871(+)